MRSLAERQQRPSTESASCERCSRGRAPPCHARSKEAVDAEPLFDFLREIVSECPVEQSLPAAPGAAKPPRKQKAAGDESTAPKRQKAAGGKAIAAAAPGADAASSSAGAGSSTLAPPPADGASLASLPPLSAACGGVAFGEPPPAVSNADLFPGAMHPGSTFDDDGDDYDAE